MDKVAGRVVWLLGWVVSPVVWLVFDGLVLVVWCGVVIMGDQEPGIVLELVVVASVTGVAV